MLTWVFQFAPSDITWELPGH